MMGVATPCGIIGRIVRQLQLLAGDGVRLVHSEQRDWASATFSGARHCLDLLVPGETLNRLLACLPEHDFGLASEIVADCTAACSAPSEAGQVPVRVEVLTILAD